MYCLAGREPHYDPLKNALWQSGVVLMKKEPSLCIQPHLPMTLVRLKTVIFHQIFFFILLLGLSACSCSAGDGIAPDRNIPLIQSEAGAPEWKILWDRARNFTRDEDYAGAVQAYEDLFRIKPNIEEANWEYCKVLLQVEDFATAAKITGWLLDQDPDKSEYLLAGGAIAAHSRNYPTAVGYYGRVFEKDPLGENSDSALLGLATSLRNQGKKELSFALLEQFSLRHPENNTIVHYLALDAVELGKDEKARKLYAKLLETGAVDDRILFQAAQVFDVPGFEEKRKTLLVNYLQHHPDYMPFRQELAQFYLQRDAFEAALSELIYLADNNVDNENFLLQAATICQRDLKRPDKALFFYERYSQEHPGDLGVQKKIRALQLTLAQDFLAIVENDGAEQLWKDLAAITPNRLAIYLEMADLLENNGQTKELIEVLTIIHENTSAADDVALRIADQYFRRDEYAQTLKYLKTVRGEENKTIAFYRQKGEAERQSGMELAALASLQQCLLRDPLDMHLRTSVLSLAGKIGDVEAMNALFKGGLNQSDAAIPVDFVFAYLDLLAYNYLFQEYEKINAWANFQFAGNRDILTSLAIRQASALRKEGKTRRAEQQLRQLLNQDVLVEEVLFRLAENAVIDKNSAAAASWYLALQERTRQVGPDFSLDPSEGRMLLLKTDILKVEGKYENAQELLDRYLGALEKSSVPGELQPLLHRLQKQRCRLSFHEGKLPEACAQCRALLATEKFDPELLAFQGILHRKGQKCEGDQDSDSMVNIAGNPVVSRLLALAGKEIEFLEYDAAKKHLRTLLKEYPSSVAGRVLWAELMLTDGKGDIAAASFSQLVEQFPEEGYFPQKRIEVEVRRGMYSQGLALMMHRSAETKDVEELATALSAGDNTAELLTLARLLWGDKQQEKALQIYRQLLAEPVLEQLNDTFRQKQIDYPNVTRESTFWNRMVHMLQSEPKVLAELMEPPFLLENRGKEVGKIVSEFYEDYSWQKLITNEYMARKATFDRNYYYAEQSYKRLLKENSSEGMSDLAKIYGKIGKYRKEAQVYETMQDRGTTAPGLEESIERTSLQISPQSIFNAAYEEKTGRDGNIDMARTSLGTSFWLTPDLDKDIRFLYANNQFASVDTDASTRSNFLYALATYEFSKAYELVLGAGIEEFNDLDDTGIQYEAALKGQLDDFVSAYLLFEKRQVYDTIAAIKEQVTFQAIETGLTVETPLGLSFGGDVHHRYYNDSNSQNRFHGFSSYSIFGESVQLALRYDYQYLDNEDRIGSATENGAGAVPGEVHYWSPSSFTEHRVGLHFQHDFLGYELGSKKSMSYYAIDNAVGLEDNENLSFTTKIDIFLEMSPHFLLKGNFTLSKSDDYAETGMSMSLHYRW
jgi:predicted Zn-dependent protease